MSISFLLLASLPRSAIFTLPNNQTEEEEGKMIDSQELMEQAPSTVLHYMDAAVKWIDKTFGEGYAKQHPKLVGSFICACATDFQAGVIAREVHILSDRLHGVSEAINK